jgi:hypothetical protein
MIDTTFTFANLPAGQQTVSLHFRNAGNKACRLQGQVGPSFAVDGHSMNVAICWICNQDDKALPIPERQAGDQFLLAPGGRATVDLHWESVGSSCQWADWVDFFVKWAKQTGYLLIPSEWPLHICSAVRSSGYRTEADSLSSGVAGDETLRVSVLQNTIYNDERATLHVELTGKAPSSLKQTGCADLYTVRQGRLDPLIVLGSKSIPSFTPEQIQEDQEREWPSWKGDRLRRCDIEPGMTTVDAEIPAADLANVTHIEWRTPAVHDEHPAFLIAAAHFTVLDVDTLAPNWGEIVQGIHAGLSVDRASFSVGERIPLHIRWENVDAAMPLGQGEYGDPEPALEIQDSQHHVLRTVPMMSMCMGHGWEPLEVQRSKPRRIFQELSTTPVARVTPLPGPGVYYLVSVWSPRVLEGRSDGADPRGVSLNPDRGHIGDVYATARSLPVRIEVVPSRNP